MAANKNTPKSAPASKVGKPAAKPAKPVSKPATKAVKKVPAAKKPATAKKPTAATKKAAPLKKAATTKKATPTKKAASVTKKAPAPVDKAAPAKKTEAKPAARAKTAPAAKAIQPTPQPEVKKVSKVVAPVTPVAKAPTKKTGSSLIKTPVAPAPVKPPFVPPKAPVEPTGPALTPGSNGSHSPAFVQKQRQRLLDLRDDLVDSMSGMTRDTIRNAPEGSEASGSGQHQGDAGSDAYDRDFALSVLAKEQDALYEIEQALRRIQAGNYGICEISSRKIPSARLEAIPFARLTVECQAQWEKEYGKRRFRPSNEVGFSGGNTIDDEDSESVSLDEDED